MHAELLRSDLDRLVLSARPQLRAYSLRKELAVSLENAAAILPAVPAALFVSRILALAGFDLMPFPSLWLAAVLSLVPPLLYFPWSVARSYYRTALVRSAALALYDRQLDLQDRLVTAEEFLNLEQVDAFSAAAIEDAASFVSAAQQAHLDAISRRATELSVRTGWYIGGAVALLLLAAWMSGMEGGGIRAGGLSGGAGAELAPQEHIAGAAADSVSKQTPASAGSQTSDFAGVAESSASAASAGDSGAPSAGGRSPALASENSAGQGSRFTSREGSSASASKASGQGQSGSAGAGDSGSMTDRSAGAHGSGDEASADERPAQDRNAADSTLNAAQGAADSESRNSSSKRAGAGAQPATVRNAQSNPSSRDSSGSPAASGAPGEGQGGSPGSKTGQKKSRGVASLILGEPLPDRVQGQPTSGPSRATHQQVAPQPESADAAQAQQRAPRSTAMQPLLRTQSPPWMQDLIERYFNRQRADGQKQ